MAQVDLPHNTRPRSVALAICRAIGIYMAVCIGGMLFLILLSRYLPDHITSAPTNTPSASDALAEPAKVVLRAIVFALFAVWMLISSIFSSIGAIGTVPLLLFVIIWQLDRIADKRWPRRQ